ncbi:hypothetical protein LCGC14_3165700 [marine sediment metagenome]|uniref:Uncharacterized protein n=1 Tax=marine sediment metagenome TaxID=412755 RepID=A0A0F8WBA3_9ZZZZ
MKKEKTMDEVVNGRLKWHRTETVLLWLILCIALVPIAVGIGIYLYVDNLSIAQYLASITTQDSIVSQLRLLYNLGRGMGVVLTLAGIVAIALAVSRLSLAKESYRMASFIISATKDNKNFAEAKMI